MLTVTWSNHSSKFIQPLINLLYQTFAKCSLILSSIKFLNWSSVPDFCQMLTVTRFYQRFHKQSPLSRKRVGGWESYLVTQQETIKYISSWHHHQFTWNFQSFQSYSQNVQSTNLIPRMFKFPQFPDWIWWIPPNQCIWNGTKSTYKIIRTFIKFKEISLLIDFEIINVFGIDVRKWPKART